MPAGSWNRVMTVIKFSMGELIGNEWLSVNGTKGGVIASCCSLLVYVLFLWLSSGGSLPQIAAQQTMAPGPYCLPGKSLRGLLLQTHPSFVTSRLWTR